MSQGVVVFSSSWTCVLYLTNGFQTPVPNEPSVRALQRSHKNGVASYSYEVIRTSNA